MNEKFRRCPFIYICPFQPPGCGRCEGGRLFRWYAGGLIDRNGDKTIKTGPDPQEEAEGRIGWGEDV